MSEKMTQEELDRIIALHEQWLEDEYAGERAVFIDKEICGLSFKDCCLSHALFVRTDFKNCHFDNVSLSNCKFIKGTWWSVEAHHVNFGNALFKYVTMRGNTIKNSSFKKCYMYKINIESTLFKENIFDNASFICVYLDYINMTDCLLEEAYFFNTVFFNSLVQSTNFNNLDYFHKSYFVATDLHGVFFDYHKCDHSFFVDCRLNNVAITDKAIASSTTIVPEAGSFIGYKAAFIRDKRVLVTLKITKDSKRSNANGRKCRCSKAKVLSIVDECGNFYDKARSAYDVDFIYQVGETVEVENFDDNRWEECAAGIHFFLTKDEALAYNFG